MWISLSPAWLLGLAIASAAGPVDPDPPRPPVAVRPGAPSVDEGRRYRVICHFQNNALASEALRIAEAVWPWAERLYGQIEDPSDKAEVHLYRTRADYEAAEQRLTGGYFRRNLAFSHWNSRSAHILVQPVLAEAALEVLGLPHQTRYLISHESAHLARFLSLENYRYHPRWLADGTASWIDENVMRELDWLGAPEDDPTLSTYMVLAQRLLAGGRLPPASDFLTARAPRLEFYDTYAVHYLLFRYLRSAPELFERIVAKLRRTSGSPRLANQLADALNEGLDAQQWRAIDAGFERYVGNLAPRWHQPFNVLETHGDEWVQTAFEEYPATSWHQLPIGSRAWQLSGEAEFLPKTREMTVLVDSTADGFAAVRFEPDFGVRLTDEGTNRVPLPLAARADTPLGERVPFVITYDEGHLTVELDGQRVIEHELGPATSETYWGLRVGPGGAGVWRAIRLRPL